MADCYKFDIYFDNGNKMPRLFSILAIFMFFTMSVGRAETTVSLVVDVNEDIGAQAKLVKCVFDQLPEKLDVVEMPWKRGQIATENGTVDGFFIAARTDERNKYATASEALRLIHWFYIMPKESNLNPQASSFYEAKFGSSRGTRRLAWLMDEVQSHNPENRVEILSNTTQGLSELHKGKLDVLLSNEKSIKQALFKLGQPEDNFNFFPVLTISGGVYFGHKFLSQNPDFLERFNQHVSGCVS